MINNYINKYPLIFSLLLTTFWVALLVIYVKPIYNTIDDVQLEWILSGTLIMDAPNADVYFINIFFSNFLVALYKVYKQFNWYGFLQILIIVLSVAYLNYLLFKQFRESILLKIVSTIILFLFLSNIVVKIQFTQTAQLATFTGYAVIMFSLRSYKSLLIATLFLSIGLMMRWEGFVMASFIGIPSLFFRLLFSKERPINIFKIIALPMLIPLLLKIYHEQYYSKIPGWNEHLAIHNEHVLLFDYIFLDRLSPQKAKQVFTQSGWSENDWNMLNNFFIEDDSIFSISKMKRLTVDNNYLYYLNKKNIARLKRVAQMYIVPYNLHLLFVSMCFVVIPAIVFKNYYTVLMYLFQSQIWVFVFFCIVVLFFRMPALRFLMVPLFFPAFCAMFFNTSEVINFFRKYKFMPIFLVIFCTILIGLKLSAFQIERNKHLEYQKDFKNEVEFLKQYEDKFLVLFDWGTPYAAKGIFTSNKDYINLKAWYAGNDLHSPTIRKRLAKLNLKKITTDLPSNKNMVLVTCRYCKNNVLVPYLKYMKQFYKIDVNYKVVGKNKSLILYELNNSYN